MTLQSTEYAATPQPWKLPRNNPWWCPKDDLLHIPRALRREKWTKKEWERHRAAQQRRRSFQWQRTVKTDTEIFAKVSARKAEKERRAKRSVERKKIKVGRIRRRQEKAETTGKILDCIALRPTTAQRISKALGLERKVVKRAIRRLLKQQRIEKISPKVYGIPGREQAPKPRRRKRLPKRSQRKRL